MKICKKLIPVLIALSFVISVALPAYAAESLIGYSGQTVTVDFTYRNIKYIDGELQLSDPSCFSIADVKLIGLPGGYNQRLGTVFGFGSSSDCIVRVSINILSNATVNDSCDVIFSYDCGAKGVDVATIQVRIDYSELNRQIARTDALHEVDYTVASWGRMTAALQTARAARVSSVQSVVDSAAEALKTALDALEMRVVDLTELEAQIQYANSLISSDYTPSTWANVEAALKTAENTLTSKSQTAIDAAANGLRDAIAALKRTVIDYSALKKQIQIAEDLNPSDYTSASWAKTESALKVAKAALFSTNQSTIDQATASLKATIATLVRAPGSGTSVDYTELNRQISIAEALNEANYSEESWAAMYAALTEAKLALDSRNQSKVTGAATALKNALAALEKLSNAQLDTAELLKQIAAAQGLTQKEYTNDSRAALEQALMAAQVALLGEDQQEIDSAAENLKKSIAGLVKMDYSALQAAINAAEKMSETEELAELWLQMHNCLDQAQQLLDSGDQAAVNACAELILELSAKITEQIKLLKQGQTVEIVKEVPVEPIDNYCNIGSHGVWQILFWISLSVNLAAILVVAVFLLLRHKKVSDDTPLVDYDIGDDAD